MSTATPGNINSTDILRSHQERIVARPWFVVDDGCRVHIFGPEDAGGYPRVLMTLFDAGREEADFVVGVRNVLPEIIRSMDNRDFRIQYLERRLAEFEDYFPPSWVPF